MNGSNVTVQLAQKAIQFSVLRKDSPEISDLETAFEKMVGMSRVAEIEWSGAKEVRYISADTHAELFEMAAEHLISAFTREDADAVISVIPFDQNDPTIVLPAGEAVKAVEILLELQPLWMLSLTRKWCFEWRRASHVISGYFEAETLTK